MVRGAVTDPRGLGGFVLALLLALLFSAFMLPQDFVAGTGAYWQTQTEDTTQYLAGFNAFFGEPWRWPALKILSLNWPEGTLATFVDIVPLFSALLKLVAPPSWFPFNPFGYWILLCFCLQSIGGWWLLREAGNTRWVALAALCLLLLLFPAWLNRFGHVSLFSQWILLFALVLVLREKRRHSFPALGWGLLLFSALFINIYLCVMSALLFAARWVALVLGPGRRQAIALFFIFMVLGAILVGITMWPMPPSQGRVEFGFGHYSMNMLAPISGGALWTLSPDSLTPEQRFEGLNYLGAGTLFLLLYGVIGQVINRWRAARHSEATHPARRAAIWPSSIWLVLLLMALYALSNHISLGSLILHRWPVPDWALPITGQLRASGRFFWPLGYALTIFAVISVARSHAPRAATAALISACCIQIIDLRTYVGEVRGSLSDPPSIVLDFQALQGIVPLTAQTLYLFPKLKCNARASFMESQLPFMLYASLHKMNINTGYIARHTPTCSEEKMEIASSNPRTSLYVFISAEYSDSVILSFFERSAAVKCQSLQAATVCTQHD